MPHCAVNATSPRFRIEAIFALGISFTMMCVLGGCAVTSPGMNADGARLFRQGQRSAAIERFNQAIAADSTNPDSYYNLGTVYHAMAKTEQNESYWRQAENYYRMALDARPDHANAHRGMAVLLVEQNRPKDAFALLEDWVQRSPLSSDAHVELARLHREFGDKQQEERQLLAAVNVQPRDARARAALGKIREEQGDLAQAYANYTESFRANRLNVPVAARLAALRPTVEPIPVLPAEGGTRTVQVPPPTWR